MHASFVVPNRTTYIGSHSFLQRSSRCTRSNKQMLVPYASPLDQFDVFSSLTERVALSTVGLCCAFLPLVQYRTEAYNFEDKRDQSLVLNRSGAPLSMNWGGCESDGPREEMEDAWCVRRIAGGSTLYLGVFDGHGGAASSAYLKDNLIRFIEDASVEICKARGANSIETEYGVTDEDNPFTQGFERADSALLDHLGSLGDPECWSGSTATVCFINIEYIVCANVGDSRAVLGRKGKWLDISSEHRPVGSSKSGRTEISRIKDCGGWVSQMRVCGILAVSRAFGDYEFKGGRQELLEEISASAPTSATLINPPVVAVPDVKVLHRSVDDDFLIIATDGLWDVMTSAQAITFVRMKVRQDETCTMDEVAHALVERALKSRTQDNVSCIVIDVRVRAD